MTDLVESLAKIKIKADGIGATVVVNGKDVSRQVTGYEIIHSVERPALVKLAFWADVEFEGDGQVVQPSDPEQIITMTMGEDGRLQIDGTTEIKLTVGEPAVFVRRQ